MNVMQRNQREPRVGVVGFAYPGYNLGEKMCGAKLEEMLNVLQGESLELVRSKYLVLNEAGARKAGEELAGAGVDCVLAVITTFVPDHFIVEVLDRCDVPVFLWAIERELSCISLVCGPLITATLFELKKHYRLAGSDIGHADTLVELLVFARAAMLRRVLRTLRVGYVGGKPPIMFSMTADDYTLKRVLGATTVTFPIEEFYSRAKEVQENEAVRCWQEVKSCVGRVSVTDADGVLSTRYYLAAMSMCQDYDLDALSLNCFPHLKSKVCLAVARQNDTGIPAACEGDLHSTILMYLLYCLTGRAAFNGDFLRMYPETNDVLFSHCGAGAFSLAASKNEICLQASVETRDGLAVCYPTKADGPMTLINLTGGRDTLRLAAMCGEAVATDLEYEGTPLRVRFEEPVREILQRIARTGAGHHWNGMRGDFRHEFALLCEFLGMRFNLLTDIHVATKPLRHKG